MDKIANSPKSGFIALYTRGERNLSWAVERGDLIRERSCKSLILIQL